jgi:hypothetical protein
MLRLSKDRDNQSKKLKVIYSLEEHVNRDHCPIPVVTTCSVFRSTKIAKFETIGCGSDVGIGEAENPIIQHVQTSFTVYIDPP